MKTTKLVACAAVMGLAALGAECVQACSASDAIDRAKKSQDVFEVAKDVVSTVLDQAGIQKDVETRFTDATYGTKNLTATPLDVATGAMMVDRYGKVDGDGTLSASALRSMGMLDAYGNELPMTPALWTKFLGYGGGRGVQIHYGTFGQAVHSVRDHVLFHAREVASGAPTSASSPAPAPVAEETPAVPAAEPVVAASNHAG